MKIFFAICIILVSSCSVATSLVESPENYEYQKKSLHWLEKIGVRVWESNLIVSGVKRKVLIMRGDVTEEFLDNSLVLVVFRERGRDIAEVRSADLFHFSASIYGGASMAIYVTLQKDLNGVEAGHYLLELSNELN